MSNDTPTNNIPGATNVALPPTVSPGSNAGLSDAGLSQLLGDALHPLATVTFSAPTDVTLPE